MNRRWIRRLLVAGLLISAIVALRLTIFRPKLVPVTVFRVARGRVEQTVTNSKAGTVKSRRRATLSPEIGGRVRQLRVRKGDRARRGDILMRLADGDYLAQVDLQQRSLEAATASANESCAAAELAERDLARHRRLADEALVSSEQLDQVQGRRDTVAAACEAARARVRQASSALELARVNLGKTVLRAPFDAVVAKVSTEVGEWITPSPPGLPIPPVIELIDAGPIYVSAQLDEVDVAKIHEGQPVRLTLDAFPGRAFMGRLVQVGAYVSDVQEQNRTFEVEVEFGDAAFAQSLLPGTSADVEVILNVREGVLRIPSYALIQGNKVLVVRGDTLVAAPVKTGLTNWEFTEITDGLSPGDLVVVSLDRLEVREGARVRLDAETLK